MKHKTTKLWLAILLFAMVSLPAMAADIELKGEFQCRAPLVLLGDISQIQADDPQEQARLERIVLFPAPPAGRTRSVRLRQIQDILNLHKVNLAQCRFAGASTVKIHAASNTAVKSGRNSTKPQNSNLAKIANGRAAKAIVRYLQQHVDENVDWSANVQLNPQQARSIYTSGMPHVVQGGSQPWAGQQRFMLAVGKSPAARHISVMALIARPELVVVSARSLRPREVLRPRDLQLGPPPRFSNSKSLELVHRIEDVIGKETTRSIPAGHPIDLRYIRMPRLVKRGEVVTVVVRTAGLKVTTRARANEDGSRGDLITVQSLENRERYTARVVDIQEVEVFAGGTKTSSRNRAR